MFDYTLLLNGGLLLLGTSIGGTFADIDLAPPLPLKHRSFWTHGPLIPLLMTWLIGLYPALFWFTIGFLPAFALHLGHDMFPKKWHGGAYIKLYPLHGSLGGVLSFLYLGLGALVALRTFVVLLWNWWG